MAACGHRPRGLDIASRGGLRIAFGERIATPAEASKELVRLATKPGAAPPSVP